MQPVLAQQSFRIDGGIGLADLDADAEFNKASHNFNFDEGLGLGVNLWVDKVGKDWLSLGLGYSRSNNDWGYSSAGTIFGGTYAGTATLDATTDTLLANIAARKNSGKVHPYVGVGAGMAHTDVDATLSATLTVNGRTWRAAGSANDNHTGFAWQVFGGLDYDITDKIYIGGRASYLRADADVFAASVVDEVTTFLAVVGIKF